jgi:hypothetical protein
MDLLVDDVVQHVLLPLVSNTGRHALYATNHYWHGQVTRFVRDWIRERGKLPGVYIRFESHGNHRALQTPVKDVPVGTLLVWGNGWPVAFFRTMTRPLVDWYGAEWVRTRLAEHTTGTLSDNVRDMYGEYVAERADCDDDALEADILAVAPLPCMRTHRFVEFFRYNYMLPWTAALLRAGRLALVERLPPAHDADPAQAALFLSVVMESDRVDAWAWARRYAKRAAHCQRDADEPCLCYLEAHRSWFPFWDMFNGASPRVGAHLVDTYGGANPGAFWSLVWSQLTRGRSAPHQQHCGPTVWDAAAAAMPDFPMVILSTLLMVSFPQPGSNDYHPELCAWLVAPANLARLPRAHLDKVRRTGHARLAVDIRTCSCPLCRAIHAL